jgi:hypothetical protein
MDDMVEVIYGRHNLTGQNRKGYAYHNGGLDLRIGDLVVVPPTSFTLMEQVATVVATHSDYNGHVKTILCRASEAPLQDREMQVGFPPFPKAVALEAVELIRSKLPPEAWHHALDDMAIWLNVVPAHVGCTFPGIRLLLQDADKLRR